MAQGFQWQKPDLDGATLRENRHFGRLREYLHERDGYYYPLASRRTENTDEYTIVYVNTIQGEKYKVTDTSIERLD